MDGKYTIITTIYTMGQMICVKEKDEVKRECERHRKLHELQHNNEHMIIEVVNNETGEVREYWNSNENKINF